MPVQINKQKADMICIPYDTGLYIIIEKVLEQPCRQTDTLLHVKSNILGKYQITMN